ncbi:FadR/GntR family transcriptional regulator [uncultured Corynebacterium sp.]|uniref:FadR/GntR family transcriptional regulator n=1 Tax=uncultured Corynebacterium sp. TaxID=159447 RepID=UPI0025F6D1CD|nr:FadR/GntR family transcriptional regulator [uncultured Corynebacterium sp.]
MPESSDSGRPAPRTSTHSLVVEAIENRILSGELGVGDMLPPERQLAEQLGVSRAAAREAIRVLEGHGVLESHVGSGSRAGTFITSMPTAALSRFLKLHVALNNFDIDEVVQTRMILEVESARMAADQHEPEVLERMAEELAVMDGWNGEISREEFGDADTRFHVALARGGGNRLFADMTQAIRESLRAPLLAGYRSREDWESLQESLQVQHRALLDAVSRGDADQAARLAAEHIRTSYQVLSVPGESVESGSSGSSGDRGVDLPVERARGPRETNIVGE